MVKNASGRRAAEVFMETTEEHKVLRPIKRAKIQESHTVTEKGPPNEENWSYRASWRGGYVPKFAMRQQRKDVSPKYKEAQRRLRMGPDLPNLAFRKLAHINLRSGVLCSAIYFIFHHIFHWCNFCFIPSFCARLKENNTVHLPEVVCVSASQC